MQSCIERIDFKDVVGDFESFFGDFSEIYDCGMHLFTWNGA